MVLTCVIVGVDPAKFMVNLSTKKSDLAQYDRVAPKKETKKKVQYVKRNIHHPMFKNVSRAKAIDLLKDEDVGEYFIRPSKAGTQFLNVTRKVHTGIFMTHRS